MISREPPIVVEVITDPVENAKARVRREKFDRNWEWFNVHAPEIYCTHRGKVVCVAGQELFVADTPEEVLALARAAHPDDDGRFTRIIPQDRIPRISQTRSSASLVGRQCSIQPYTKGESAQGLKSISERALVSHEDECLRGRIQSLLRSR